MHSNRCSCGLAARAIVVRAEKSSAGVARQVYLCARHTMRSFCRRVVADLRIAEDDCARAHRKFNCFVMQNKCDYRCCRCCAIRSALLTSDCHRRRRCHCTIDDIELTDGDRVCLIAIVFVCALWRKFIAAICSFAGRWPAASLAATSVFVCSFHLALLRTGRRRLSSNNQSDESCARAHTQSAGPPQLRPSSKHTRARSSLSIRSVISRSLAAIVRHQ